MNFFSIDYRLSSFSSSFPKIIPHLNEQQQKIAIVATAIFAVITATYLLYRFFPKNHHEDIVHQMRRENTKYQDDDKNFANHKNKVAALPRSSLKQQLYLTYIDLPVVEQKEEQESVINKEIEEIKLTASTEESTSLQPLQSLIFEVDGIVDSLDVEEKEIVDSTDMDPIDFEDEEIIDSLEDWVILDSLDSSKSLRVADSSAIEEITNKEQQAITDVPALVGLSMGLSVKALSYSSVTLLPKGFYSIKQIGEKFFFIFPVLPFVLELVKTISQDHTSDLLPTKLMRAIKQIEKADLLMTLLSCGLTVASAGISNTFLRASIIAFEISSEAIIEDFNIKEAKVLKEGEFENSSFFPTFLSTVETSLRIFSFYQVGCDNTNKALSLGGLLTYINLRVVKMLTTFFNNSKQDMIKND